jgi:hypothetical protein
MYIFGAAVETQGSHGVGTACNMNYTETEETGTSLG